jgi:dihydroorotate dehydrogenase (NAD+) catalytic subunit
MVEYAGGVFVKSVGKVPREGNMEPVVVQVTKETMLNAMSLPNPGRELLREELEEIYPLPNGKKLGCSVFGETSEDFVENAGYLSGYCDLFELNFSCPNKRKGEKSGLIARNPETVYDITKAVKSSVKEPVTVKLTPNVYDIGEVAGAAEHAGTDAISGINTKSSGMKIDIYARRPVLSAKFGGVSGRGIKAEAVAAIYNIYESVKIPIFGGGGVGCAEDVIESFEAGSDAVGLGTAFFCPEGRILSTKEIETNFKNLKSDLERILEGMNVKSLKELKGVAHVP